MRCLLIGKDGQVEKYEMTTLLDYIEIPIAPRFGWTENYGPDEPRFERKRFRRTTAMQLLGTVYVAYNEM